MDVEFKPTKQFSSEDIKAFKKIVIEAGEVSPGAFDGLIYKNPFLLFYPNTTEVKAVGALKFPHESYKNMIFKKSNSSLNPKDFKYEMGWIVSLTEDKGTGQRVTKILSDYKDQMYATIRADNPKMNHIIRKFRFVKSGDSFKSARGDYYISLYVKMG